MDTNTQILYQIVAQLKRIGDSVEALIAIVLANEADAVDDYPSVNSLSDLPNRKGDN